MSKLTTLLAIPVGLFVVKGLQDTVTNQPNTKPIIPTSDKNELPGSVSDGFISRGKRGFGL